MPRLNVVDPKEATGKVKEIFDGPLKTMQINIFKGIANSPAALQGFVGLKGALSTGLLSAKEQEVIALSVGQKNGCRYCTAAHTMVATNIAGMTQEQAIAARKGESLGDPKLDAVMTFALALCDKSGKVDDSDLEAFKAAGFTDAHISEVIAHHALNVFTNVFNHVNQTEVDFPPAPALD